MRDKRARQPLTENWRHNHMKNMTLVIIDNMTIPLLQLQTCYIQCSKLNSSQTLVHNYNYKPEIRSSRIPQLVQ